MKVFDYHMDGPSKPYSLDTPESMTPIRSVPIDYGMKEEINEEIKEEMEQRKQRKREQMKRDIEEIERCMEEIEREGRDERETERETESCLPRRDAYISMEEVVFTGSLVAINSQRDRIRPLKKCQSCVIL